MPASKFCRGSNGDCNCECFWPKADDVSHCWECSHGMSKHPDTDQMAAQAPQSQLTPILGSANVAKIFQNLTSKDPFGVAQPNAHQEALATKGTKTSKPATSKTSNATTDEHKVSRSSAPQDLSNWLQTSAHRQPSGQLFHISSVAIVTCGLNVSSIFAFTHQLLTPIKANGHLKDEPLPQAPSERRRFVQHLENHGCYIQRPIQINTVWTLSHTKHVWYSEHGMYCPFEIILD